LHGDPPPGCIAPNFISAKRKRQLERLGIKRGDVRIDLKELGMIMLTGLNWLRIGSSGGS
jgi:hypothetical protein